MRARSLSIAALAVVVSLALAGRASADTLWGLTTDQTLVRFTSTAPGTILANLPITGLPAGEQLIAINISGQFLGISSAGRLYSLDRLNGTATPVAEQTGRIVVPSGTAFELIPVGNGLELTSNVGQRIRMRVPTEFEPGDWGQVLQSPFTPLGSRIVALGSTYLATRGEHRDVAIDSATDSLYEVNRQNAQATLSFIGALGVDASDAAGLARSFYEERTTYAALTVGGVPGLYRLAETGQPISIGPIASAPITSLAADAESLEIVAPPSSIVLPPGNGIGSAYLEGTALTVTLRRVGDLSAAVDYRVSTVVPLFGPADFTPVQETLHFAAGEREKTVAITLVDDALREQTEYVDLYAAEERLERRFQTSFRIHIVDDDNPPPVLTVTAPSTAHSFTLSDTFTVSGFVTDDRPGVRIDLYNGGTTVPTFSTTSNPFTFTGVPLDSSGLFRLAAVDADGESRWAHFHLTRATAQTFVLAEGATGSFFKTEVLFANPDPIDVPVTLEFLREDGSTVPHTLTVPAVRRVTLDAATIPGLEATATAVVAHTTASRIAVERTMRWDARGYGGATERASTALSPTWYFAEGSQGWFSTFLLLVNPQATDNEVTIRFLRESGGPVTKTYTMAPRSRITIDAGAIPELVNRSFGMEVTFAQPGAAERSMYFGQAPLWSGGHASAGATAPATDWFLAEGATGTFFETFVLVANPSAQPATVTLTYLPASGVPVTRTKEVPANGRLTVNIEYEDPSLANAAVATRVTSSTPIVVERSQYWPFTPDRWNEAHNSMGETTASTRWILAEGRVGGAEGYQSYILLANPHASLPADVQLTFLRDDGDDVVRKLVVVPPASRFTVSVDQWQVPEIPSGTFGVSISSNLPIVVERSMYWNANGEFWAAGSNAAGTPLPF